MGDWFRLREYAKSRCLTEKQVFIYCDQGMPHTRQGKQKLIFSDDADSWIKAKFGVGYASFEKIAQEKVDKIEESLNNIFQKPRKRS